MMKILVTGANGQLGTDMVSLLKQQGHEVFGLTRKELDITVQAECKRVLADLSPNIIVHCAAYTAVDTAEEDIITAYQVNADGTRNIAVIAESMGIKFCYISTDYVFDGTSTTPYHEYDNTNPVTIYGKSKRAGELLTQSLCSRYFIIRTSWVYGQHGSNFVKTMLKLGNERDQLSVVSDQVGSPTYTVDLARFIGEVILTEKYGIYHASNRGECSWYEFAKAIFEEAGKRNVIVNPCTTEEFSRPAPRPAYSVLNHIAIKSNGFQDLPEWRDALRRFINQMNG